MGRTFKKDERPTSNIQRSTSNGKQTVELECSKAGMRGSPEVRKQGARGRRSAALEEHFV